MRLLKGALWFHVASQGLLGGLGFALAPGAVFSDIGGDALARLCLRLAAYTNVTVAAFSAFLLVTVPDRRVLRALAAAGATYHLLAGLDAIVTPVALAGPHPAPFHGFSALLLAMAAARG